MPTVQKTFRILAFIKRVIAETGEAPTIAQIGKEFNMRSSASVHRHLQILKDRGLIARVRYGREIEIVKQEQKAA